MSRFRFSALFTMMFLFTAAMAIADPHGQQQASPFAGSTAAKIKEQMAGKNKPVLVDFRSLQAYKAGHIPGAVNIPSPAMKMLAPSRLPKNKTAPIIIYAEGQGYADTGRAITAASKMGYTNINVFGGGMIEWVAMHYPVKKGSRP